MDFNSYLCIGLGCVWLTYDQKLSWVGPGGCRLDRNGTVMQGRGLCFRPPISLSCNESLEGLLRIKWLFESLVDRLYRLLLLRLFAVT